MGTLLTETNDKLLKEDGSSLKNEVETTLAAADTVINGLLPAIEAYQDNYILSNPYYFQGLQTHSQVPSDDVSSDRLSVAPSGKSTTWADTGLVTAALPFTMAVHEYVAPGDSKGWQVELRTVVGGINYTKTIGYGVEAEDRTHGWIILDSWH